MLNFRIYFSNSPFPRPVLRILDILVRIRILGSLPLTNGSGCDSGRPQNKPTDPDSDPEHWYRYIYIILQR
jgi:hypothetical protein